MTANPPEGIETVVVPVAASGDRDVALAALWSEHYGRLAGWCAALVGDTDAAHDVAAEAFVRLMARWRTVSDPRGFLYVTALNLVRDGWRRRATGRRMLERLGSQRLAVPVEPGWLGEVVRELPERLQGPVLLHYYADLSVDHVAATLGRPVGTIKRQLSDAREQLAARLQEDDR